MIRLVFALSLSIILAVVLALGIAFLNELPDSGNAVPATHLFTIR